VWYAVIVQDSPSCSCVIHEHASGGLLRIVSSNIQVQLDDSVSLELNPYPHCSVLDATD
jgi:hypothetical protein